MSQKIKTIKKIIKKSHNSLSANMSLCTSLNSVLLPQRKQNETPFHALHIRATGSFTLEAAVALPVFAAFMAFILFFFRIIMVEQNMTEAMELSARELSTAAFAEQYGIDEKIIETGSLGEAMVKVNKEYSDRSNGEGYRYFWGGKAGLSLLGSDVEGDYVTLRGSCVMRFPVELFGKKDYLVQKTVKVRKWTGYSPVGDKTDEEEDIWVYVTPHGNRYHKDRNCSYLELSTRSVSKNELDSLRNKDGARYVPCQICGNRKNGSGIVYITDYGTGFHTDINCSGLRRGISMVLLKEAEEEGYGPCSKCG